VKIYSIRRKFRGDRGPSEVIETYKEKDKEFAELRYELLKNHAYLKETYRFSFWVFDTDEKTDTRLRG